MSLGRQNIVVLDNGSIEKRWSLDFNKNQNYNWFEQIKLKEKYLYMENEIMAIINEEKRNPDNTITKFQNIIIFHHIYQHFIILMVMIVFHLQ